MVNHMMKKSWYYHLFLFLSTFTRGLVEVFSLVLLYQKGFSVDQIMISLFFMYSIGILVNYVSLKMNFVIVLIISSLLYGISFLYLSFMEVSLFSLFLLSFLLASSNYSNHSIRHLLALYVLREEENSTRNIVVMMYLGIIFASLLGMFLITHLSIIVTSIIVFVFSFLSIMPVFKLSSFIKVKSKKVRKRVVIDKRKVLFSIFEQFKVLFLEVQPLFLYLYVGKSVSYVGIFHVIVNIASLVVVYFISKRIKKEHFKYYCFLLGMIFLLKQQIQSSIFLLGIAFLEGVFVKIYESVSLDNLYDFGSNSILNYLMVEEFIFFISKSIIMLFFVLFHFDLRLMMYICIVGIVISGFFIRGEVGNQ